MNSRLILASISIVTVLALNGCNGSSSPEATPIFTKVSDQTKEKRDNTIETALTSYADLAIKGYSDALRDAKLLEIAIKAFTANPTEDTLTKAKNAWLVSRESYGPTEIFRLSNGPIDAEKGFSSTFGAPEGQLNAWPLDENMIDYTSDSNGKIAGAKNIINTPTKFTPPGDGAKEVNTTTITPAVLSALNENGGDANVATGYHAIEFLLWGQDQDYVSFVADNITPGALIAGKRPLTDYTTDENAQRRKDYLNATSTLLVSNLQSVLNAWTTGGYKDALIGKGTHAIAHNTALKDIFAGMGLFIKSELANERIAVALNLPSEEDEHSCFSDNTHRDIALNYQGFKNALAVFSPNLSTTLNSSLNTQISLIDNGVKTINDTAKTTRHFDYQIQPNSEDYTNIKNTKNNMRNLGDDIVTVALEYGISLTTTSVTDQGETKSTDK